MVGRCISVCLMIGVRASFKARFFFASLFVSGRKLRLGRRCVLLAASVAVLSLASACGTTTVAESKSEMIRIPASTGMLLQDFPWPPPAPSSSVVLEKSRFKDDTTFGGVSSRIERALNLAEYAQWSYYAVPGGMAIVAELERTRDDAFPAVPRFLSLGEDAEVGPLAFLHNLFFAPAGHYRQIVFVVTDQAFVASAPPPTREEAEAFLTEGAKQLPPATAARTMTQQHRVEALIYEFRKQGSTTETLIPPQARTATTHLSRAGILSRIPPL